MKTEDSKAVDKHAIAIYKRTWFIFSVIGVALGSVILAYAISRFHYSKGYDQEVSKRDFMTFDLTGQVKPAPELAPGDELS